MNKMDTFNKYFTFKTSAHRLEVRPAYDCGEIEEVQSYMNGKSLEEEYNKSWIDFLKQCQKEGKIVERVRILPDITNNYNRYELAVKEKSSLASEQFYFIKQSLYDSLRIDTDPTGDYWILDNEKVLRLFYDEEDNFLSCDLVITDITPYLDLYNRLKKKAIPFTEILKETRKNIHIEWSK